MDEREPMQGAQGVQDPPRDGPKTAGSGEGGFYFRPAPGPGAELEGRKVYGPLDQPERPHGKGAFPALTGVLAALCLLLAVACGVLGWQSASLARQQALLSEKAAALSAEVAALAGERGDLADQVAALNGQVRRLEADADVLRDQRDSYAYDCRLYADSIGFVVSDSDCYHTIQCGTFLSADGYWAHNVEYCSYLGYTPCPDCWGK